MNDSITSRCWSVPIKVNCSLSLFLMMEAVIFGVRMRSFRFVLVLKQGIFASNYITSCKSKAVAAQPHSERLRPAQNISNVQKSGKDVNQFIETIS